MAHRIVCTFLLNSGATVKVKLRELNLQRNDTTLRLEGWECTGDRRGQILHLDPSTVDMITMRKAFW